MDEVPPRIGRFEVQRAIGRGMTGVVYEAHDPVLTRSVALKTIDLATLSSPSERESFTRRFQAEARIAARLHHPNIVVVHDVGRDPESGLLYIALERLPGETLAAFLSRGVRLAWRTALDICRQVAEALDHAHALGVVHRDIKPANVMLLPSGAAKLMDFGIAKLETAQLTASGQFFGTPLYMSPEQVSNSDVDARADIFSLGSLLYTLLTGRHAFEAGNVAAILQKVMTERPASPGDLVPDLPPAVDDVVARCMAKRAEGRYPQARDLGEDLGDIVAGHPPRHTPGRGPRLRGADAAPETGGGPLFVEPTVTVDPVSDPLAHILDEVAPVAAPPRAGSVVARRTLMVSSALLALGLGAGILLSPSRTLQTRNASVSPPGTTPAAGSPAAAVGETPVAEAASEPAAPSAQVVVDYRHPLRSGSLRVLVDEEALLSRTVQGGVSRNLLVARLHAGVATHLLDVAPGTHQFEVVVSWDDQTRRKRIRGVLAPGETYRLEVRLGRLRRNLSVKWTR